MPSIATGANAANRSLTYLGISGDGDSLSIGVGQLVHAIRRNLDMLYVIENNGVYGLTKGQFSASADVGTKSKRGEANQYSPIDPVSLALELGASFVARAFSGDKGQLVPILKAGLSHKGFALIDVISPCVTFNDHEGSTKSYLNTRKRMLPIISTDFVAADFVPPAAEITTEYAPGSAVSVQLHDGSTVRLRKLAEDYDTGNRQAAADEVERHRSKGEVPTGLFFVDTKSRDMHDISGTTDVPLSQVPYEKLCPGSAALDELQKSFR
jgi:2-oxoglutarate ferredoxin oxidoreductase subunit beta